MKTIYKLTATHIDDDGTESITTKEFEVVTLSAILPYFREFLLGVGFSEKALEKYGLE